LRQGFAPGPPSLAGVAMQLKRGRSHKSKDSVPR
jgi:hypothetical protein